MPPADRSELTDRMAPNHFPPFVATSAGPPDANSGCNAAAGPIAVHCPAPAPPAMPPDSRRPSACQYAPAAQDPWLPTTNGPAGVRRVTGPADVLWWLAGFAHQTPPASAVTDVRQPEPVPVASSGRVIPPVHYPRAQIPATAMPDHCAGFPATPVPPVAPAVLRSITGSRRPAPDVQHDRHAGSQRPWRSGGFPAGSHRFSNQNCCGAPDHNLPQYESLQW